MKIVGIIPAHLASVRFPRKVLFPLYGLPMIEHVRRRALLCPAFDSVYVATCDEEIAEVIREFGGKVIMTSDIHRTGTDRVAEAVQSIDCSHVVVLQGDEPLLLPEALARLTESIVKEPDVVAWNVTGPLIKEEELDQSSIVKCMVSPSEEIIFCCRRSPCLRSSFGEQQQFCRKILGLIAFTKPFLQSFARLPETPFEHAEFIEQSRILESGFRLRSVALPYNFPSVNEPQEADIVQKVLENDVQQKAVLELILSSKDRRPL